MLRAARRAGAKIVNCDGDAWYTQMIGLDRQYVGLDDYFDLTLHYGERRVRLSSSTLIAGPRPRFAVHGTLGSFVKYGLDPQEDDLKAGLTPAAPHWGEEPRERWGKLNTTIAGSHFEGQIETMPGRYQAYYQNIGDAIRGEAELAVKPEEAMNTIRIIELAMHSAKEKCTVDFSFT